MKPDTSRPLLIVGNGEIASMAYEYFLNDSEYTPVAFAIGKDFITSDKYEGLPLVSLEQAESQYPPETVTAFVAIGDAQLNRVRAKHYRLMKSKGYKLASYVSSRCFRWHNVQVGDNCLILEDNTLQPFVTIGDNVILWSGNHIGHRTVIRDHVFVTSHVVISGFCDVGEHSYIGVNVSVAHRVKIEQDNYLAMAAAIGTSTARDLIYQGNPAEPRKIPATRFCRVRAE